MPVPFDLTSTRARPRCIAGSTLSGEGRREGGEKPGWLAVGWVVDGVAARSATSSVGNLFLSGHRRFIETSRDGVLS